MIFALVSLKSAGALGERGKVVFECAADQAFVAFVLAFLEWLAALTLRLLHPAMRQT